MSELVLGKYYWVREKEYGDWEPGCYSQSWRHKHRFYLINYEGDREVYEIGEPIVKEISSHA